MPKPTVAEFRAVRLCTAAFQGTADNVIQGAIDEAYTDYGIKYPRACVYAAAHLLARDDDDIAQMDGDPAAAVDLGTGAGVATDSMDGDRRTVLRQGVGTFPGVSEGTQYDVAWQTTIFGRRYLDISRRRKARNPILVV